MQEYAGVKIVHLHAFLIFQDSLYSLQPLPVCPESSPRISDGCLQLPHEALMSCGDGANDLQLVANSGIGVAMGNAVPAVRNQSLLHLEALSIKKSYTFKGSLGCTKSMQPCKTRS